MEGLPAGEDKRVRAYGLDADLVAAGLDGLLDVGGDALLQRGEERVLLGDGQCEQAVEEARHGRQLLLETALVDELEAGGVLEPLDGPALDAPEPERAVELAQRRLRIQALNPGWHFFCSAVVYRFDMALHFSLPISTWHSIL